MDDGISELMGRGGSHCCPIEVTVEEDRVVGDRTRECIGGIE